MESTHPPLWENEKWSTHGCSFTKPPHILVKCTVWWNFPNIYTIQELLEEGESAALKELEGFKKEMSEKLEKFRYTAEQWNEG